ncbi:type IV pilus twitching motility protein PilT [Demequina sp. NBRC 110056]|uniref:type IV pilus twitching motility protein PilT n=1 Tax=Demequina sp. NBRC 110056 TaxID=1570345 RepID=UPI0026F431F7|nr:PilT/PilU family type 4a pilus ATPase [Demequina sp. NBRC 110056]
MTSFMPEGQAGGPGVPAAPQPMASQPGFSPQPPAGQQPVPPQGAPQPGVTQRQPMSAPQPTSGQIPQGHFAPAQPAQPPAPQQPVRQPMSQVPAQAASPVASATPAQTASAAGAAGAGAAAPAAHKRIGMSQDAHEGDLDISMALRAMLQAKASDLHVTTGAPPMVRVDGGLRPIEGFPRLEKEGLQRALYQILTQAQREKFEEELELDFSYALVGEARFRVNMYKQRESVGAAFRLIPYEIKPLEALGVPEVVANFASLPRGLVLVTGPTGSGKSTTLASLVDLANRARRAHIMTVEDPIEFLHRHKRSLVNQREVGADTKSFQRALKHVLRQDPDIILIGEMRDLETISVALTAAETGHLVFATLHTQDAAQTIDRVIDVFPAEQQGQVRVQLATAIQGVVCQTLLPRSDTSGRAVAVEVMVATPAIRNLIREGKTHQIYTALQAGAALGMQSMDQHLADLVKSSVVAYDDALEMCQSYEEFNRLCGRHGRVE